MVERICLIKSVLSSIPLFFMSLFRLPSGVADKLVRIQRNFLWGWGSEGRKIAWPSWEKVCKPREFEGLCIIDTKLFNVTLLGKWIWRLGSEKGGLWKEIFVSKYGGWRSLGEEGNSSRSSPWWKYLKEVWASEGLGRSFEDGFKWKVGDGNDISFWKDNWMDCGTLKRVFPRLFSINLAKEAMMDELGSWSSGVWVWQLPWRKPFFDWEKSLEGQLHQVFLEARLVMGEVDSWVWKVGGLQMFSVNSTYIHVRKDRDVVSSSIFSKLWKCKTVPYVVHTAWRMLENKLATKVNLERRGMVIENSMCCLCGKEVESYCHLFFDCSFTWHIWCLCFKWLGVSFVSHFDPTTNFDQFRMSLASNSVNDAWSTIWVRGGE